MSTEENKQWVHEYPKDVNAIKGDTTKISDFVGKYFSPDFIAHGPTSGEMNSAQFQQYLQEMLSAFPDTEFALEDLIAEGDKVVLRMKMSGTHQGELQGIPPTGRRVMVGHLVIYQIADSKVIESWGFPDTPGMMQQLGVIPAVGGGGG